jgi:phosphatidylethanolamine/phosphatidyl-N-methylethanolamine N-methyltransferase
MGIAPVAGLLNHPWSAGKHQFQNDWSVRVLESLGGDGLLSARGIREHLAFFLHFVKHPIRVGAPAPCSRRIAGTIARELSAVKAQRVVELGAGLGSLTRGILEAVGERGSILCIERDAPCCKYLERQFGNRVTIMQGDALQVPKLLAGTPWQDPDAIVCSVPLVNGFAHDLCRAIAGALPPQGLYLQVANFPGAVEANFDIEKTYLFLGNLPPERLHRAFHKSRRQRNAKR